MPIYEYTCNQCKTDFELLILNEQKPVCPNCDHDGLTRKLSVISTPGSAEAAKSQVCDPLPGGG